MPADAQRTKDGQVVYIGDEIVDKDRIQTVIERIDKESNGNTAIMAGGRWYKIDEVYSSQLAWLHAKRERNVTIIKDARKLIRQLDSEIKKEINAIASSD